MSRVNVHVSPASAYALHGPLLAGLETILPVTFSPTSAGAGATLLIGGKDSELFAHSRTGIPCLAVPSSNVTAARPRSCLVHFADVPAVPRPFRGRSVVELRCEAADVSAGPMTEGSILATRDGVPIWLHHSADQAQGPIDISFTPLPDLAAGKLLAESFDRNQFMPLLPLLHFLRRLDKGSAWEPPDARACFIFDDPNLRRPSYGCVDFAVLAAHARARRYHAAVATIPLDASRASSEVAALFRDHPAQLSLAIHGNDHSSMELARAGSEADRTALLAQAQRRMAELSRKHRVPVCAVAEPPHGAIRTAFFSSLATLGYEAALLTVRQYRQCNPDGPNPVTLGLGAAESLPGGLAMIPRITAAPGWETESVLARFLGQPIVIAGHHFDAADGLKFLDGLSAHVDALGPVIWSKLSDIARSRYMVRRADATLRVRLASRRILLSIPDGIDTVAVEAPWLEQDDGSTVQWKLPGAADMNCAIATGASRQIPVVAGGVIEVLSPVAMPCDPEDVPPPRSSLWPRMRRAATEARDRCYPFLPRGVRQMMAGTAP